MFSSCPSRPKCYSILAITLVGAALLGHYSQVSASTAMLRIACDEVGKDADVSINGAFKGQCPVDVSVAAGTVRIQVTKKLDNERELYFEQDVRMAASTVKRIDVEFGVPRLNVVAQRVATQRAEQARVEADRAAAAKAAASDAAAKRAALIAAPVIALAEAGDSGAMAEMGNLHATGGLGLPPSDAEAIHWYRRAAQAGNVPSIILSNRPSHLSERDLSFVRLVASQPLAKRKLVNAIGTDAIRALIATERFFETAGGKAETIDSNGSCSAEGRLINMKASDASSVGTVGGLVSLQTETSMLFRNVRTELGQINWIEGQPFPPVPGSYFAISFDTLYSKGEYSTQQFLACKSDASRQDSSPVLMTCLEMQLTLYHLSASIFQAQWHQDSGCLRRQYTLPPKKSIYIPLS